MKVPVRFPSRFQLSRQRPARVGMPRVSHRADCRCAVRARPAGRRCPTGDSGGSYPGRAGRADESRCRIRSDLGRRVGCRWSDPGALRTRIAGRDERAARRGQSFAVLRRRGDPSDCPIGGTATVRFLADLRGVALRRIHIGRSNRWSGRCVPGGARLDRAHSASPIHLLLSHAPRRSLFRRWTGGCPRSCDGHSSSSRARRTRNDDLRFPGHRILSGGRPSVGCPVGRADRFRSGDPTTRKSVVRCPGRILNAHRRRCGISTGRLRSRCGCCCEGSPNGSIHLIDLGWIRALWCVWPLQHALRWCLGASARLGSARPSTNWKVRA